MIYLHFSHTFHVFNRSSLEDGQVTKRFLNTSSSQSTGSSQTVLRTVYCVSQPPNPSPPPCSLVHREKRPSQSWSCLAAGSPYVSLCAAPGPSGQDTVCLKQSVVGLLCPKSKQRWTKENQSFRLC
jgi:hypothetical protein